ncbi:MAG: HAMP domain-containing histidine kinase [Erysipelotrichaceae bacterium]|nr:HAMP domain-containing histidine kinase [Erysipelotrichaceae bacterium]
MMFKNRPNRWVVSALIALFVFVVLALTAFITVIFITTLIYFGFINTSAYHYSIPFIFFGIDSVIIGLLVSCFVSRIPSRPLVKVIDGMQALAQGHYDTRIQLGKFPLAQDMETNFNHLAEELKNTELLRSDFVNNFSHEFKTPIVSIKGFAKILKDHNLSKQQQNDYLDIIIDESERLADMATNVLELSKVEKQTILTNITKFNVSEQIRNAVILLEKKWEEKNIDFDLSFTDYYIEGSEELLKEVWINLLDNSIKFAPINGHITIFIKEIDNYLEVSISNDGEKIKEKDIKRIFEKFYQGDTSHASKGTGIGLSIVSQVVNLHKGHVSVTSNHLTTFSVSLPLTQFI